MPTTVSWNRSALLVAAAAIAAIAAPAAADATLSLADATIRVERGTSDGDVALFMARAEGLSEEQMKAAAVRLVDLAGPGATARLRKLSIDEVERGRTSRAWLLKVAVSDLPGRSSQKRFARLSLADLETVVPYTLTDVTPSTFSWTVAAPPSPWLVWSGSGTASRALPILVTMGEGRATGLRLVQASLREANPTSGIGFADLVLCEKEKDEQCDGEFAVEPLSNKTFWLRLKTGITPRGKYTGSVSLSVNEKPELQSTSLVVHASTWWSVALGLVLLVVGTGLGWSSNVWARARVARLEALTALGAVRERAAAVGRQLGTAPLDLQPLFVDMRAVLDEIQEELATGYLDARNLLPPLMAWAYRPTTDNAAALKDHLTSVGDRLLGLQGLIDKAARRWWTRWAAAAAGSIDRGHLEKALRELDGVARLAKKETDVDALLQPIADQLAKDLPLQGDPRPTSGGPVVREPISWKMARIQRWGWLLWGGLTVLSGYVALIVPNAGFGTTIDFVFCFFWGLGLPVAIDRLQSLGPGGVAGAIGVTVPKLP